MVQTCIPSPRGALEELNLQMKAESPCNAALPHNHQAAGRQKGCVQTTQVLVLPHCTQACQPLTKAKAIWLSPATIHPWFSEGKVYTLKLQDCECQVKLLSAQNEVLRTCSSLRLCLYLPRQHFLQTTLRSSLLSKLVFKGTVPKSSSSSNTIHKSWHTAQGELGRKAPTSQLLSNKTWQGHVFRFIYWSTRLGSVNPRSIIKATGTSGNRDCMGSLQEAITTPCTVDCKYQQKLATACFDP